MRTINFRGKTKNFGNIWVYGDWRTYDNSISVYKTTKDIGTGSYTVDPATVGQFTGLCDKNGKEIYEGDICVCKKTGISINPFCIFWMSEGGCWGWQESDGSYDPFYQSISNYTEVIGNIHDNSELL